MAAITATPDPSTGTVLVQVEQTIARDTFTRVVANGWGSPTFGPAYTVHNAVAQFSVNGTVGIIDVNATGTDFMATLDTGQNDHEIVMLLETNTTPVGGATRYGVVVRFTDTSNYFRVSEVIAVTTGAVTLEIGARVAGTFSTLTSVATALTTATNNNLRVRTCGNMIMAKVWNSATAEPSAWNLTTTYPGLPTGTRAGALARRETGNSSPTQFQFDNSGWFTADGAPSGSDLRLYRVTSDGVRTEVQGSPFSTEPGSPFSNAATAVFWDGDAPFDTNIFYEMTSTCGETVLTSNTVVLDSDGFGWIRDPLDPTRNFPLALDGFFDECVDQDLVVFSGFGDIEYTNASGVFDKIDAARPNTISQKRKNYASSLNLTSFSLGDILDLEDILADGRILSLSLPGYGWAQRTYGTDYITIFDVGQSFVGVDQQVTARGWVLPFRLSSPPQNLGGGVGGNGIGGGGATYDELAASVIGTTYNSLTASGFTYNQIAAGTGY